MAKGPQFFVEKFMVSADALEAEIDSAMEASCRGGHFTFNIKGEQPPAMVQEEIIRRYLKAGWRKVGFHSGFRGDRWIEFGT